MLCYSIDSTTVGEDTPILAELYLSVVPQFAVHWETIAALLGLEQHHINNISKNNAYNPNRVVDGCVVMLHKWLQTDTTATWGKLEDTINLFKHSPTGVISGEYHNVKGRLY